MALNLDTLGLSATVTAEGISAPDYQTIHSRITGYFQQIYGTDAYLEPDSKDGQTVALVALAIHDANNTAIQVYGSFSAATAMSDALTRNVKINGIARKAASNSTVDLVLSGTAGTTVTNGSAKDDNGVIWNLPASVTIGTDGIIATTATCDTSGAVATAISSVSSINTPTRGWVSVTNPSAATVGSAAEKDTALRTRQAQSVALPSLTPFDAVDAAIANVSGVVRHKLYENDTKVTNSDGVPGNSISAIVDGGDVTALAQAIRGKKGQGVGTYGSTSVSVPDRYGNPHTISFSRPADVPVFVAIEIKVFTGYTTAIGEKIKSAVAAYINALGIGDDVLLGRLYSPANLTTGTDSSDSQYYDVMSLQIGRSASSVAPASISLLYDESASCDTADITLAVVT